jgi:lipopolysaccharide biosynthesis glycosyltransferase
MQSEQYSSTINKIGNLNIAIAFDLNYLQPFYVLLESVLHHHQNISINFHLIIKDDVNENDVEKIKHYIELKQCTFNKYIVDENLISKFIVLDKWQSSVYYKMFFPLLVSSEVDKLLYIDTDTVVNNPLTELFDVDLGNYPLAAVYDNYVKVQTLIGINKEGNYFNSGVMLINTKVWIQQKISENAIAYLQKHPENIKYVDQCALNAVLINNWHKLPTKYNLIYSYVPKGVSISELKKFSTDKVIIHYTIQRPWQFLCNNRLKYIYIKFLKQSKFTKNNYIVDYKFSKIPDWIRLRISEIYLDYKIINLVWRKIKHRNV